MMSKFKLLISTGIFALFFIVAHAQATKTSSAYTYDANGNRLKSYIIYLSSTLQDLKIPINNGLPNDSAIKADSTQLPKEGWTNVISDPGSGFEVKLYPNPTKGMIILEVSGVDQNTISTNSNFVEVWDLKGAEVLRSKVAPTYNLIDLGNQPNGTYVLRVNVKGLLKVYKIIKE